MVMPISQIGGGQQQLEKGGTALPGSEAHCPNSPVSGPHVLAGCSSWGWPRGQYQPDLPFGHLHSHRGKGTEHLLLFREGLSLSQESSAGQPSCLLLSCRPPSLSLLIPSAS